MAHTQVLGQVQDIPLGTARRYTLNDAEFGPEAVVVIHTSEGMFALEDRCSHADVALSEGEVDGCFIECWLHGSAFDVRTGVPSSPPAVTPVKTFPIEADINDPTGSVILLFPAADSTPSER